MPMFLSELDRIAGWIKSDGDGSNDDFTCYLHTEAPTDASPTNGRVTAGGAAYQNGKAVLAANVAKGAGANRGDLTVNADIDFGTATADVNADITHWSLYRGGDPVAYGTLPTTTVSMGDTFKVNRNTVRLNASTS